jgi:hypothetical protein
MNGRITVGGVVSRTARLVGQHWRLLFAVAVAGVALKRAVVWAIFDFHHLLLIALPAYRPSWNSEAMLRSFANGLFDTLARAVLIGIVLAVIRGAGAVVARREKPDAAFAGRADRGESGLHHLLGARHGDGGFLERLFRRLSMACHGGRARLGPCPSRVQHPLVACAARNLERGATRSGFSRSTR